MTYPRSPLSRRLPRLVSAGLLALALTLGAAVPALADSAPAPEPMPLPAPGPAEGDGPILVAPKVTRDEAIARARATFDIPPELGEPSVNLWQSSDYRSRPTWNLEWRSPDGSRPMLMYHVGVDGESGEIVAYNMSREGVEQQPPLSLTRREAETRAAAALEKLAGSYLPQLRKRELRLDQFYFYPGSPAQYGFNWERLAEGVPVEGNGVQITIDARTGELLNYSLNWDRTLVFSRSDAVLGLDKAEALYRDQVKMELVYQRFWEPATDKPSWRLVYRPRPGYPFIAADTGELLDESAEPWNGTPFADLPAVPLPAQPWVAPAEPLTQEQALELAKAVTGLTRAPTSAYYSETDRPRPAKVYSFSWQETDGPLEPGQRNYDIAIDAVRGVVLHFGSWGPGPEQPAEATPAVDRAGARQTALDALVKFRPDLAARLRELPSEQERYSWCTFPGENAIKDRPICDRYNFRFQLLHNNIPLLGEAVSVEVDVWTGQVAGFWAGEGLTPEEAAGLSSPESAIAPAGAMASFLQYEGLRLAWRTFYSPRIMESGEKQGPPQPRLVYGPNTLYGTDPVDAFTGHILDGNGRDLNRLSAEPEDIDGHWAQKEIEILLVRGIFELGEDNRFNPAAGVTRGEAARWLLLAKGLRPYERLTKYSFADLAAGGATQAARAAAPYAEAALDAGILVREELGGVFEPEKAVSREEFALWAIRAMGYGAIARMPVQIPMGYDDAAEVGAQYRNAVALLAGLGVISGEGEYRPQETITRAEAAKILFSVASERRN